jgi:hypothetical protein
MTCPKCNTERIHPSATLCPYEEKVLEGASFSIASAAMPTRGRSVQRIEQKEARWDRDGEAFKRLKAEGINPPSIDGCREMEQTALSKEQIETAQVHPTTEVTDAKVQYLASPAGFRQFEDRFGRTAQSPA